MRLTFIYSKIKEKEKLLSIYDEYQWFLDNDFPVILPKFYAGLYKKYTNNKKQFSQAINKDLDKIYNKKVYQQRAAAIKNDWQKINKQIFNILKNLKLNIRDKYICSISLYGAEGQFQYPNIVNLRANTTKDLKDANDTIVHELIHLLIYNKAKKLKLSYEQTEGVVDLFFTQTELKNIFPKYKMQNIANHNKKIFEKFAL